MRDLEVKYCQLALLANNLALSHIYDLSVQLTIFLLFCFLQLKVSFCRWWGRKLGEYFCIYILVMVITYTLAICWFRLEKLGSTWAMSRGCKTTNVGKGQWYGWTSRVFLMGRRWILNEHSRGTWPQSGLIKGKGH